MTPLFDPNPVELKVLAKILREMRQAVATTQQLQILFDPWNAGGGAYLSTSYSGAGFTESFEGKFTARKSRRQKTR